VRQEFLHKSETPYTCPWKGKCQYFTVIDGDSVGQDMAWSYPEPLETAIALVGKDFANYVAFWKDVTISE
jgi:uncharacterized protein (DUF427 family)